MKKKLRLVGEKEILKMTELFSDERELRNVDILKSLLWKRIYDSFDERGKL